MLTAPKKHRQGTADTYPTLFLVPSWQIERRSRPPNFLSNLDPDPILLQLLFSHPSGFARTSSPRRNHRFLVPCLDGRRQIGVRLGRLSRAPSSSSLLGGFQCTNRLPHSTALPAHGVLSLCFCTPLRSDVGFISSLNISSAMLAITH